MKEIFLPLGKIWVVGLVIGIVISFFTSVSPFFVAACFSTWPIIGMIVTIDDDLPGGWSNPDGDLPFPTGLFAAAMLVAVLAWLVALIGVNVRMAHVFL